MLLLSIHILGGTELVSTQSLNSAKIYLILYLLSNLSLNTTISNEYGTKVSTIEHLMGALFGLGIDNVLIEINSEEVPILDGSGKIFVEKLNEAGVVHSNDPIKVIKINNKVDLQKGPKRISIEPSKINLEIDFEIEYNNPLIGLQKNSVKVYEDDLKEIYESRTFCLYEDIENLRNMGFAKGGSLNNAVVVKDNELLNKEGLRNNLEFVNHKILDCMGDLYLAGFKIIGSIKCSQGGHSLTNQLLRQLFKDKSNYSIFEINEKSIPHSYINKLPLKSIA